MRIGIRRLIVKGVDVNTRNDGGNTPLHLAAENGHLGVVEKLIAGKADISRKNKNRKTPLNIAKNKGHNKIVEYLEKKLREKRGEPLQRKRRHHLDQPKIARNDLFSQVKSFMGKLLSSKSNGTASSVSQVDGQYAKTLVGNSGLTSTTLPSDGKDKRQENGGLFRDNVDYVNANLKRMRERQAPVKFRPSEGNTIPEMGADYYLSQVNFNGTIMLFDLLIRRVMGQKYISTADDQSISTLKAQGYALNITKEFEKVVKQAGLKSGVSMHRLNIDYMGMQEEITRKIMNGQLNKISGILKSYVEKACPGREAGCPGRLSLKKFDKFMLELNSGLNVMLQKGNSRLEASDEQINLGPRSCLNNASIQGHLIQDEVELIS